MGASNVGAAAKWSLAIGVLGALVIAGLARLPKLDTDPDRMDTWPPTADEVYRTVGGGPAVAGDPRLDRFCEMLTHRYRARLLAVRVIVHPPDRIELRCGANMTWQTMARVAVQVAAEAEQVFGRPFRIDVYATYVAAPKRKVGELTPGGPSRRARLIFDAGADGPNL